MGRNSTIAIPLQGIAAVSTPLSTGFTPGRPEPLFRYSGVYRVSGNMAAYDVDGDGRFIMVTEEPLPPNPRQINVVLNWFEELRERVPTGR